MKPSLLFITLCLAGAGISHAQEVDLLQACWQKQARPFQAQFLRMNYTDSSEQLYHSSEPWQTYKQATSSTDWFRTLGFQKSDTLHTKSGKAYFSKTAFDSSSLLVIDFGDTSLSTVTQNDWYGTLVESARYTPILLLDYVRQNSAKVTLHRDSNQVIYELTVNQAIVKLAVGVSDTLVGWISVLKNDDLRGDVETKYTYSGYRNFDGSRVPLFIHSEKYGGRVIGTVMVSDVQIVENAPVILLKPANFHFIQDQAKVPDVSVTKFSDHIHFIDLKHTEARSIIVEFSNFLAVIDAPLSSANGELVIAEAKKIAPNKTIKYFAFGHHHPWYVGGMRPFVYRDVTVLTTPGDVPYLQFLATAPHTLGVDSLFLRPHPLRTQEVRDSLVITDGSYEMKMFWIGKASHHTADYTIFYFPKEKLLEEDDLAWILENGKVTKADDRQAGLVSAVHSIGIVPEMVVQSWPLSGYGVKTIFPFSDLEASVLAK